MSIATAAARPFLFDAGPVLLEIAGRSMVPVYQPGDRVKVKPWSQSLIGGRIYLFRLGNELILHRYVGMSCGRAVFVGDRSAHYEYIDSSEIVGEPLLQTESGFRAQFIHLINRCFMPWSEKYGVFMKIRYRMVSLFSYRVWSNA